MSDTAQRVRALRAERYARRAVWAGGIATAVLLVLAPLYVLVKYAVSANVAMGHVAPPIWPDQPTFRYFMYLFTD